MANFKIKTKGAPPSPLVRPRPAEDGNFVAFSAHADGFSAYVHRDVLEFIERESRRADGKEVIGLLAGRVCQDLERVPYTLVMAAEGARGDEADSGPGHVHISPEGRSCVRRRLEETHPDREIVGWYHSHPHHEARFSSVDAREQAGWVDPNQLGIVFSGTRRDEPFCVYRGPQSVLLSRRRPVSGAHTPQPAPAAELVAPARSGPPLELKRVGPGERIHAPWNIKRGESGDGRAWRVPRISTPRLAALLLALGLTAFLVWLHARVRAVETALGADRKAEPTLPTPAMPDEPRTEAGASGQTALTDAPAVHLVAKPTTPRRKKAATRAGRKQAPRRAKPTAQRR